MHLGCLLGGFGRLLPQKPDWLKVRRSFLSIFGAERVPILGPQIDKIRKNRSFILKAVKIHGSYLRHADNKLQNNKSIALAAIKNDHFAWDYVGEKLKKDIKFINAIPLSFYKARKKWKKYL